MAQITKVAQGSLRPSIYCIWQHADNSTPENLTGAALSGWIKDLATGTVRAIAGDLVVTDGATGAFRWDFAPADVEDEGTFEVQFSATWNSSPTPGRTAVFEWEIANSIMDDAPPAENVDYQGVVRLLVRTTDPDAPQTGYIGLWAQHDGIYLTDDDGVTTGPFSDGSVAAGEAIAAHVLEADPHTQYLLESTAATTYAPVSHTHTTGDVTGLGEYVQDTAAAMITGATHTNVSVSYDDNAGTLAITAAPTYTDEQAQDAVAAALAAGTHTNITVAYDDAANSISLTGAVTYTDEKAQDAVASMLTEGAGIDLTYDDGANTLTIASTITQYTDELAQDAAYAALSAGTHTGVTVAYDDTGNAISLTNTITQYTNEMAQDTVAGMLTEGAGIDLTYDDNANTLTVASTITQYTDEMAQDAVAGMLTQGSGITLTYSDVGNTLTVASSITQYTDELAQDAAAAMLTGGTHTGITATYVDASNVLNLASTITQYTDEMAQDAAASMLTTATHSGASVSYDDAGGKLAITVTDQGGIAKSLLDAKGDIIAASADNTPAKVAVGTDGYILTAASAETAGVKWAVNAPAWADVTGKPSIYQSTLFLHTAASGVSTYKTLLTTPSALSETTATASANSGTGEILIAAFASPPMGVSVINGNAWNFQTYAKVDSTTGVSQIVVRVYKRTAAGVETQLFFDTSAEINATTATLYEIQSVQTSFSVATTDRMVIKYYAKTTSGGSRTFTLYFQGTDNYSHISTPVLFASLTMATDTLWDAKGDIAIGTGADTADRLAVGTDAYVLTADSAQTLGVKWAALPTMYTDENAQDAVAAALAAGSHTGITVTYTDASNSISLASTITQYTDEAAQDAAASMITGATHSGLSVAYDDAGNKLAFTVTDQGGIAKSLIDAKGDLIVGSADNTAARLAVGTDTYVLTADSSATNGVKWAAAASGGDVATDAIWDAKGDLAVGTGANTASKLAVGANDYVLTAASGEATGVKWAAIPSQGGIPATLIDAKGDLIAGSAADTAARLAVGTNGFHLVAASGEATGLKWQAPTRYITLGRYGTLTATAGSDRLYVPYACTIVNVYASVSTAPTGADLICDVHKGGTTLFSTQGNRPTIAASAFTDATSTPDVTAISAGDYLTLDVDQIGSTIAGADLRVILEVTTP